MRTEPGTERRLKGAGEGGPGEQAAKRKFEGVTGAGVRLVVFRRARTFSAAPVATKGGAGKGEGSEKSPRERVDSDNTKDTGGGMRDLRVTRRLVANIAAPPLRITGCSSAGPYKP